nr:MAG TPA: hypothetical protein [Bacteriophage sp.]
MGAKTSIVIIRFILVILLEWAIFIYRILMRLIMVLMVCCT